MFNTMIQQIIQNLQVQCTSQLLKLFNACLLVFFSSTYYCVRFIKYNSRLYPKNIIKAYNAVIINRYIIFSIGFWIKLIQPTLLIIFNRKIDYLHIIKYPYKIYTQRLNKPSPLRIVFSINTMKSKICH